MKTEFITLSITKITIVMNYEQPCDNITARKEGIKTFYLNIPLLNSTAFLVQLPANHSFATLKSHMP